MIRSIASSATFFETGREISHYITAASAKVHKLYMAAMPIIKSCTSIYNISLGINELFFQNCLFRKSRNSKEQTRIRTRGIAYIGAGICDACIALHSSSIFKFNHAMAKAGFIGGICFIYGNLATLIENIVLYQALHSNDWSAEISPDPKLRAILGILSSLGYILSSTLALFGAATAAILLTGIFASNAGLLKALIEYRFVS